MNALTDILKSQRSHQAALASTALTTFGGAPDVYAKLFKEQRRTQIAPSLALASPQQALDTLQNRLTDLAMLDADETPRWISEHPDNAALVSDEVPRLIDAEKTVKSIIESNRTSMGSAGIQSLWNSVKSAGRGLQMQDTIISLERIEENMDTFTAAAGMLRENGVVDYSQLSFPGGHAGRQLQMRVERYEAMTPEDRLEFMKDLSEEYFAREDARDKVEAVLQAYAADRDDFMRGHTTDISQIRDVGDFIDWAVVSGIPAAGTIAMFMAAGALTGGVGVVATGTAFESGLMTAEAVERYGAKDLTSDDIARQRVLGAISGTSEILLGPVARTTGGGLRRALTGEVRSQLTEEVLQRTSQTYLRRIGRHVAGNMAEEAVQEAFQEVLSEIGVAGEDFEVTPEFLWQVANAGAVGALSGGAFGAGIGVRYNVRMERAARDLAAAGQTVRTMDELDAVSKDLNLVERSSEKFREWAGRLGLDNTKIFYQAEVIDEYIKGSDRAAVEILNQMGISEADFQTALATGSRVQASAAGVIEALRTGHNPAMLKEEASVSPTGFTPSQATQIDQLREEITEQIEREYQIGQLSPDRQQVMDAVKAQLVATGRKDSEATQGALVVAAGFEALAKAYGGKDASGADLYERFGFEVRAPSTGVEDAPQAAAAPPAARSEPEVLYQSPIANDRTFLQQQIEEGATPEDLLDNPAMMTAVAEMQSVPVTMTEQEASELDNFRDRQYIDSVSGENLTFPDMISHMMGITAGYAQGAIRQDRRVDLLIGPPAAGKSTIAENLAPEMGARIVDPDDVKKLIPQFEGGIGANAVHEESSAIAKMLMRAAMKRGDNFVLPKVGENPDKIRRLIQSLQDEGYTVNLVNMHVPRDEAFRRMVARFIHTGRLIEPHYAYEVVGDNPEATYETLKAEGVADGYASYDNTVPFGQPAPVTEDTRDGGPDGRSVPAGPGAGDTGVELRRAVGARTLFQSAALFQTEPLDLGLDRKPKKQELAQAFTDLHMQIHDRELDPVADATDFDVVAENMVDEYREQMDQADAGLGWYTADIAQALDITKQHIPEIADPVQRDLFMVIAALTSPRERPVANWEKAVDAMEQFVSDGRIPELKQNGKRFGVAGVEMNMQLLQYLIDLHGNAGALEWLLTPKTGTEMAEVRRDSGIYTPQTTLAKYTPNEVTLATEDMGINIFGPKVSDFFLNASGVDQTAVTVDMWLAQTYNRHTGQLLKIGAKKLAEGGVATEVRGKKERDTIKALVTEVARRADVDPSAAQAALWYFEQRLERSHGINAASQSFKQGAAAAAKKRGYEAEPEISTTDQADAVRILEQRDLEQQGPRGQIELPAEGIEAGRAVITLFESADPSTFLHESGHFFLELFKTLSTDEAAPEAMREDFAKVNEWLGREANDTSEFTAEHHEQWARGFESYLREGKSPSIALRRAFQRFKDWLTRIYRDQAQLQVNLSPEIREVMDRMLATEEEIHLAKAEEAVGPMFLEHPAGMSEQAYEAYRRLMIDADDEAEQKLFRKAMAAVEKRNSKQYKEGLAAATEEQLAKLRDKKAYQLIARLQDPDLDIRLNKAELLSRVPAEEAETLLADLSREKHGGKRNLYAADGAPLAEVAQLAGYSSAGHMLRVLRSTPNIQQAAEKAAQAQMERKFPDLLKDGSMREEAREALHNTKRGQLLHMEERQIRATIEAQGGPTPAPMSMDLMRATARDMINSMSVGQASKPELFLRAERKAGNEAQKAFSRVASAAQGRALSTTAAQDLMAAHAAKRRQILNHLLYIEAKKVGDLVGKVQRKAKQLNRKKARTKIGDPYITQIDRLMEQYDFRKLGPTKIREKHALAALIQMLEEAGQADRIAIRPKMVAKTKAQHFSTLTVEELDDLYATVKNLEHLGREVVAGILGAQEKSFGEIKLELLESIEENMEDNPPPLLPREESRARRWASQIMSTVSTADTLIAQMDGNEKGELGAAWRALKAPISAAQARVHARQSEARTAIAELFETHYGKDLSTLGSDVTFVEELNHDFTKAELLSIALNTGNEDNWSRLALEEGAIGSPDAIRAALEKHLTREDWLFVQGMWDYINSYWTSISDLEMKTTGVRPKKVEASPKLTPYSFVKGGYYPIRYDARLSANTTEQQIDDVMKMLQVGRMTKAQTRDGHTKERMDTKVNKNLLLDLSVAVGHVNDVITDLELREPVKQVWRLLNDRDVQDTLRQKGASDTGIWLKLWVGDVVNGDRWASGGWNTMLRHLRGGLSIAKMGFSITTLVQQPLGLAQSMVVVGKGTMTKAFWKWKSNPGRYAAQVQELSPFMQERQETFQRDMMLIKGALDTNPVTSKWSAFKRTMTTAAFWGIQKSQFHIVDVPTWMAVYDKEIAKGTQAEEAVLIADQMVARAQGSGLLSDRSGFERGTLAQDQRSNELARLATAFGSYMMAKMNVATQRVRGTNFTDPTDVLSLFMDLILLYGVEAAGSIFLTGRWPDFEEEEKDPAVWLAGQTAASIASGFPLLRDVASASQGFGGGGAYGSVVESSVKMWSGATTAAGIALGVEDEERMRRAFRSMNEGAGVLLQLPTIQLDRAMTALFERDMTLRDDFNMLDLAFGRKD